MELMTKSDENELSNHGNGYLEFHESEILPDYQKRVKDMSTKLQIVPDIKLNHVGVENMIGTSAREKYLIEFASKCSFHGIIHIVARQRHPVERFLVILIISGCLIMQIFLSFTFWNTYQNKSTILLLDFNKKYLEILKPSFYICSVDKVDEKKFPAIFEKYNISDTPETRSFFQILSNIDYEATYKIPDFDAVPPKKWLQILYDLRYEFDVFIDGNSMQNATQWVVTERGICISICSRISAYNTLEYLQYNLTNITLSEYPLLYYNIDNDEEKITISASTNVTISMCHSEDTLEYQQSRINAKLSTSVQYDFTAISSNIALEVNKMSMKQRNCKFRENGSLKTWPIYSARMCLIECRHQIIIQYCRCLPHFARPIVKVPVCNVVQLRCIDTIKDKLFLNQVYPYKCNCYRLCNDSYYFIKSKSDILEIKNKSDTKLSTIILNLKFPSIAFKRKKIFGFIEFITAIGGAAGLFLGASLLSFIEILYYVTLRMWIYYAKRKSHERNAKKFGG